MHHLKERSFTRFAWVNPSERPRACRLTSFGTWPNGAFVYYDEEERSAVYYALCSGNGGVARGVESLREFIGLPPEGRTWQDEWAAARKEEGRLGASVGEAESVAVFEARMKGGIDAKVGHVTCMHAHACRRHVTSPGRAASMQRSSLANGPTTTRPPSPSSRTLSARPSHAPCARETRRTPPARMRCVTRCRTLSIGRPAFLTSCTSTSR